MLPIIEERSPVHPELELGMYRRSTLYRDPALGGSYGRTKISGWVPVQIVAHYLLKKVIKVAVTMAYNLLVIYLESYLCKL